jgi:Low-density lipoprotein receptor repeat class B
MEIVTEKVIWPNAVTLDFIHERMYWIDARMNWIETAKYDGQDRRTVLHMKQSHPFGLTVLGNRLYWTDWATTSISTSLVNGSSRSLIHSIQRRPMGMVAMHASRHPWSSSPCDLTVENPCDHICLARPGNLHSCLCHAGYYLVDSKDCVLAASSGGPSIHAPPRLLEFTDTPLSCVSSKDCDCSHMPVLIQAALEIFSKFSGIFLNEI